MEQKIMPYINPEKHKTVLCKHYTLAGRCFFLDNCLFAHEIQDRRIIESPRTILKEKSLQPHSNIEPVLENKKTESVQMAIEVIKELQNVIDNEI